MPVSQHLGGQDRRIPWVWGWPRYTEGDPASRNIHLGSNGKIQSFVWFELLGIKMAPGMLGKSCQWLVLTNPRSRQCGLQFFLLCPAMGCGKWVNCVKRYLAVEAVEVWNCQERDFNRAMALFTSHLVGEKMSCCPVETIFHLSVWHGTDSRSLLKAWAFPLALEERTDDPTHAPFLVNLSYHCYSF